MKTNNNKYFLCLLTILVIPFVYIFFMKYIDKVPEKTVFLPLNLIESRLLFEEVDGKEWVSMMPYQDKKDITYSKKHILFNTKAETTDEWDYIYLDPDKYQWKNYSWQFKIIRFSEFREFAFNFRYQDFDNRYRYRFEKNKIFFDKKIEGIWSNNIASTPFKMELTKTYKVKIDSNDSVFRCWVDGKLMLENVDTDIPSGSVSIILWEDNGRTDISADVYDNRVVELTNPSKL